MRQKNKGNKEEDPSGQTLVNGGNSGSQDHHSASARSILKSVLKRTGSKKVSKSNASKKKHRVQFNESLNKFFEADYVILIREEFEGECDNDEVCTCNSDRSEMVRIGREGELQEEAREAEELEELEEETEEMESAEPSSPRGFDLNIPEQCTFEPPLEFIDQVTLSPPEGYKDVVSQQQQQLQQAALRNLAAAAAAKGAARLRMTPVPAELPVDCCVMAEEDSDPVLHEEEEPEPEVAVAVAVAAAVAAPETAADSQLAVALTDDEQVEGDDQGTGADPSKFPQQRYIVETITMTTVTERRIVREADDHVPGGAGRSPTAAFRGAKADERNGDMKLSGILKGGKLWKSPEGPNPPIAGFMEESTTSFSGAQLPGAGAATAALCDCDADDTDGGGGAGRRSVRFSEETQVPPDSPGLEPQPLPLTPEERIPDGNKEEKEDVSPESTELTLTFKLGNHVLVANSLRPNSAVRQLFPAPRFLSPPPLPNRLPSDESSEEIQYDENHDSSQEQQENEQIRNTKNAENAQFVVTADSLRLFEEAKRAKMQQVYNNKDLSQKDNQQESQHFIAVMSPLPLVTSPSGTGISDGATSDDDSTSSQIRRTIERNALRRSLLRYEPGRNKRNAAASRGRTDDSLVERIKKLTCDLDEEPTGGSECEDSERRGVDASTDTEMNEASDTGYMSDGCIIPPRSSPPGEEGRKFAKSVTSPNTDYAGGIGKYHEKTSSPSSASSSSTMSSGSASSTYKKLTDLFARRNTENKSTPVIPEGASPPETSRPQPPTTIEWATPYYSSECAQHQYISPPDLGNGLPIHVTPPRDFANGEGKHLVGPKSAVSRASSTSEARKQFLSSLAPLAACVSAGAAADEDAAADGECYVGSPAGGPPPGDRASIASSSTLAGGEDSEYSLDDIEEALKAESKAPQPDVVAGTQVQPISNEGLANTVDELALFVQRDAGRIERIKKRYGSTSSAGSGGSGTGGTTPSASDEDDHDDYGFNRRPSVRGIKPRFGSTTEILQQMQTQLQPPAFACATRAGSHMTWPYCPDGSPATATEPAGARRRAVTLQTRGPMPVLQEEVAYPYEYGRGVAYADYNGLIVHPDPAVETTRKDGVARRYVSPSQIMYASTGNLYQPQLVRLGGIETQVYGAPRPLHAPHLQHPPASGSPPPPRGYSVSPTVGSPPVSHVVPLAETAAGLVPYPYDPRYQSLDRAALYGRRAPGLLHMRLSPVSGAPPPPPPPPPPGTTVRVPFADPNVAAVMDPHYGTLPHRASPVPSVIRVAQGQTVRVPYQTGVQVHLLARAGVPRSESPQRGLNSPSGTPPGVARGTQTAASPLYQPRYPCNGYKGYPETTKTQAAQPPQTQGVPRRAASPLPYQNISSSSSSTASSSPTRSVKYGGAERGVPEGAASSSPNFPQDSLYNLLPSPVPATTPTITTAPATATIVSPAPTAAVSPQSPIVTPTSTATSVYYAMNV